MSLLKELFNSKLIKEANKDAKKAIQLDNLKDKKKVHFKDRPYFKEPKEPLSNGGNVVIHQTKSGELAGTMATESSQEKHSKDISFKNYLSADSQEVK